MAYFWKLEKCKHARAKNAAKIIPEGEKAGLIGDGGEARAKHNIGEKNAPPRYFVTEAEARANQLYGEKIERIELDEIELRQAAAKWLNASAIKRAAAIKREANKTAKQRSDNMRKAWDTRKAKSEK